MLCALFRKRNAELFINLYCFILGVEKQLRNLVYQHMVKQLTPIQSWCVSATNSQSNTELSFISKAQVGTLFMQAMISLSQFVSICQISVVWAKKYFFQKFIPPQLQPITLKIL